jgi:hypothetical protein
VITEPIGCSYTTCHGWCGASQTGRSWPEWARWWEWWGVGVGGCAGGRAATRHTRHRTGWKRLFMVTERCSRAAGARAGGRPGC